MARFPVLVLEPAEMIALLRQSWAPLAIVYGHDRARLAVCSQGNHRHWGCVDDCILSESIEPPRYCQTPLTLTRRSAAHHLHQRHDLDFRSEPIAFVASIDDAKFIELQVGQRDNRPSKERPQARHLRA